MHCLPAVAGSVAHQSFRGGIDTSISTKVGIGDVVRAQLDGFTHREVRGEWFARSVLFCDEHSVNLSCAPKKNRVFENGSRERNFIPISPAEFTRKNIVINARPVPKVRSLRIARVRAKMVRFLSFWLKTPNFDQNQYKYIGLGDFSP